MNFTEQEIYETLLNSIKSIHLENHEEIDKLPCKLGKFQLEHSERDMLIRMGAKWDAYGLIRDKFHELINSKQNEKEVK